MNLDRRQLMLVGAAVVTVLAWGYKLWPSGAPIRPAARPVAAVAPPVAAAPAAPPPQLTAAQLQAWAGVYRTVRRDPFFTIEEIDAMNRPKVVVRPAPEAPPPPPVRQPLPTYTLKMVMTSGSERLAAIDDQIVKVGDRLGEERVVEILADAVVLERGGERRRLELNATSTSGITLERVR